MEPGLCVNHQGGHDRPWFTYCCGHLRGLDTGCPPLPALTCTCPSWLGPRAQRLRKCCFFKMGTEITGWPVGRLEPRATTPSWVATR